MGEGGGGNHRDQTGDLTLCHLAAMASGVGSLDSLDLLDLLFDRQDGILHGVELGPPPGAWHEDGVSLWLWRRPPFPCLAQELGPPCGAGSSSGHPGLTGTPR